MQSYQIEYPTSDLKKAVELGFHYMETMDEIVGTVFVAPAMAQKITMCMPGDVRFDYIPEGVGVIRTAYLKFLPSVKDNEIRFLNKESSVELWLYLI